MDRREEAAYRHALPIDRILRLFSFFRTVPRAARVVRRRIGHTVKTKVVIVHDGRVLLVKSVADPKTWTLPGGTVRHKELVLLAAIREVREELGFRLRDESLRQLYTLSPEDPPMYNDYTIYGAFVESRPPIRLSLELLEASWFTLQNLPDDAYFVHHPSIVDYIKMHVGAEL